MKINYYIIFYLIFCGYLTSHAGLSDIKKKQILENQKIEKNEQTNTLSKSFDTFGSEKFDEKELFKKISANKILYGHDYVLELTKEGQREALESLIKMANQGSADAQYTLGDIYYLGWVVFKDLEESNKWYKKAAELGNAHAQRIIGNHYINGTGVPKNLQEGVKWVEKAVEQGDVEALRYYGVLHSKGLGVPKR